MAFKCREEIVGKRFLSVNGICLDGKIDKWGWRAGVIRAATHKDNKHPQLQVLVEYDDVEWHRREWISIYKNQMFQLFLVEQGLFWVERSDPFSLLSKSTVLWPALTFTALVSTIELTSHLQPVEFLPDRELAFRDYVKLKPFKEWDPTIPGVVDYYELKSAVKQWAEQQDGQRILITTPSVLLGYRVEVYRAEGTTQWYTAVIVGYNETTKELTVTDDTVLEEHNEDPALIQMRLIGDGVVESIMRGENGGITPRRSRSALLQTQHQHQSNRIFRGPVEGRKSRPSGKRAESLVRTIPDDKSPTTKVSTTTNKRKKIDESFKDYQQQQQKQKRNYNKNKNKKKLNEEVSLKEVEIRVEDCLQTHSGLLTNNNDLNNKESVFVSDFEGRSESSHCDGNDSALDDTSNSSSVQLVPVEVLQSEDDEHVSRDDESMLPSSVPEETFISEEDDCVIVAQRTCKLLPSHQQSTPLHHYQQQQSTTTTTTTTSTTTLSPLPVNLLKEEGRGCSSRGDDDVPLSSSSLYSRMEFSESGNNASLRFPDDRSDSGVSSLRSSSGDERSGSRSSALSLSDEPFQQQIISSNNRSPLFIPASHNHHQHHSIVQPHLSSSSSSLSLSGGNNNNNNNNSNITKATPTGSTTIVEPVRVWRDPNLLLESEPHVRHIHSVQHQSLLMSHPSTPAASGPPPPITSASSHPPSLYPPVPPPPALMTPHPLQHHPHLGPAGIYPHPLTDMLWKQRYSVTAAHLLTQQQGTGGHPTDELLERERAAQIIQQDRDRHDRMIRERQEVREIEKHKEKERLERERQEREQIEREKQERERELEKERQKQALHNHFEKSLRQAAQQKREQWNPIGGRPPPQSRTSEDERKRVEQEMHREQRHLPVRSERDHRAYYTTSQRPPSVPGKTEYPPPPAHTRVNTNKQNEKLSTMHSSLPKPELNVFGYPVCQPFFAHEPKNKSDHHKQSQPQLVVTKSNQSIDRDVMPNTSPLLNEMKNSVIVKNDGKNPHHIEPRVSIAHSTSPKLRSDIISGHYLTSTNQTKTNLYDYRSSTQSPHHLSHTPSPHHHLEPQNLGKNSHHRQTNQLPSPHHQRQSPHHPHSQQHPSPDSRYRNSTAEIYATSKSNYPFLTTNNNYSLSTPSLSNSKPKVSSPAPHHIYGKPSAGIVAGVPITRVHETSTPIQLTSKPPLSSSVSPSPYQQVSQYHPPHPQVTPTVTCPPPPAHSSRTTSSIDPRSYDRLFSGGLSVKPSIQHGTSPPTAASAPLPVSRSHPQYSIPAQSVPQTQPLDLGVSSNKYDSALSPKRKATTPVAIAPVCLDIKKRRIDPIQPPQQLPIYIGGSGQPPQLSRVSEPSPLIASAATTITTVVNTAAYRTPTPLSVMASQSPSTIVDNLPDVSVTAVHINPDNNNIRPASVESITQQPTAQLQQQQQPSQQQQQPPPVSNSPALAVSATSEESLQSTPVKAVTPSAIDSEKSNSPGPNKGGSSYPVRHLKKAWLQRHTGEDLEDTTGVTGSGSCVTLPINISSNNKENPIHSIHSVGSMAVNSINKTKHFSNKANNRKVTTKDNNSTSLNGHPNDLTKGDDSSSSDQDRGRKSPPKRKPPKVKRKKGGGGGGSAAASSTSKKQSSPIEDPKKRKPAISQSTLSESGSDSEKESGSEKDSDSGASTTTTTTSTINASGKKASSTNSLNSNNGGNGSNGGSGGGTGGGNNKEPRKRGRRPKSSKNDKTEEPRSKKSKDDGQSSLPPQRDPFRKPPIGQLKKTGESFLQDGPCFEVAPKLAKCRECRWTPNQRSKNMPNIFCRFYAFRRLRYTKNGQLAIAGFSDPHKDALEDDLKLWLPNPDSPPSDLDLETSRFILKQVGDHFCDLFVQEKEAQSEYMSDEKTVAWKRVVQGVREMCDVCETTLFNFHWACGKCGFVVCLDCYKSRKSGSIKIWGEPGKDRDEYSWLLCTNRQAHEQEKLMLTQIIAGDSLVQLGKMVHEMRELWNIEQYCACPASKEISQKSSNSIYKDIIKKILLENKVNGIKKEIKEESDKVIVNGVVKDEKTSPLSWLADVALSNEDKKNEENNTSDSDEGNFSTLRELLIRPSHKQNGSRAGSPVTQQQQQQQQQSQQQQQQQKNNNTTNDKNNKSNNSSTKNDALDDVISSVIEDSVQKQNQQQTEIVNETKLELKHFLRRYNWQVKGRAPLPIRIMTLTESKMLYPDVPHSWLCDGKLLRLSDPTNKENYKIFQDQWKRGQPVIVSDVTRNLNKDLWNPDAFARDFGDEKNDLINCMTGNLVPNQPMRKFWEGFDNFSKRLKDDKGNPMLLKLKDWPPGEDFAEMLPSRFNDLMKVLPLSEYTNRSGRLNLASRLPECFVRPDLGPKMYNAYGSALHPSKGTTNLHLDISDAVNVMVYVGIPKDGDSDEHIKEAFRAIDEAGCDILTRRRVRDKGELPGALWHIYNARDADKIRDLLNKVVVEKGGRLEPHNDPIHDQSCYLDGPLRERLYKEYGVEGYAIVQCLGDAVFIPAGAPHQVRNLHNCIKIAEDFVSPENVSHCFHLTQEFRDLSDKHSNHEDKLQIKNIIYHAVKDALSSISAVLNRHLQYNNTFKSDKDSDNNRSGGIVDRNFNNNTCGEGNTNNNGGDNIQKITDNNSETA